MFPTDPDIFVRSIELAFKRLRYVAITVVCLGGAGLAGWLVVFLNATD